MTKQERLDRVNARIVEVQERLDAATTAGDNDKITRYTDSLAKKTARKARLEA